MGNYQEVEKSNMKCPTKIPNKLSNLSPISRNNCFKIAVFKMISYQNHPFSFLEPAATEESVNEIF